MVGRLFVFEHTIESVRAATLRTAGEDLRETQSQTTKCSYIFASDGERLLRGQADRNRESMRDTDQNDKKKMLAAHRHRCRHCEPLVYCAVWLRPPHTLSIDTGSRSTNYDGGRSTARRREDKQEKSDADTKTMASRAALSPSVGICKCR